MATAPPAGRAALHRDWEVEKAWRDPPVGEADDAVRHEGREPRGLERDDVADFELRRGRELRVDDRAFVDGPGHRAAGDHVSLQAEKGRHGDRRDDDGHRRDAEHGDESGEGTFHGVTPWKRSPIDELAPCRVGTADAVGNDSVKRYFRVAPGAMLPKLTVLNAAAVPLNSVVAVVLVVSSISSVSALDRPGEAGTSTAEVLDSVYAAVKSPDAVTVSEPTELAPGLRFDALMTYAPAMLLTWLMLPAVNALPGLPFVAVSFAPEKTSDWSATANMTLQTGTPLTATVLGTSADPSGTGAIGSERADATGLPINSGSGPFNLLAFAVPLAGQYGNAGRNTIPGPGMISLNATFGRTIQFGDSARRSLDILRS